MKRAIAFMRQNTAKQAIAILCGNFRKYSFFAIWFSNTRFLLLQY